jgi:hypothetical protein
VRQTRYPVVIKNTFNVYRAEVSKKEEVWILNIRHSLRQVVPAERLRNCRFIGWCSGHKSGLRQSSFCLKHIIQPTTALVSSTLLWLACFSLKDRLWKHWIESGASRLSAPRAGCFLLRFIEHSTSHEGTNYLTVDHSCLYHGKCVWC